MIIVICGPLEGIYICLCNILQGGNIFIKELYHLSFIRDLEPVRWMLDPTSRAPFDDERCTLMMEEVSFGCILE
jgi:hypothetical protein